MDSLISLPIQLFILIRLLTLELQKPLISLRKYAPRHSAAHHSLFPLVPTNIFISSDQAESELSDPPKREDLDAVITEARILLLREMNPPLPSSTLDSDPAIRKLGKAWKTMMREKSKELLIDEEVRRRK